MTCFLSGNFMGSDEEAYPVIENFLDFLIRNKLARHFYLMEQDPLNALAVTALESLSEKYPLITYDLVLFERASWLLSKPIREFYTEVIWLSGVTLSEDSKESRFEAALDWLYAHCDYALEYEPDEKAEVYDPDARVVINIPDYDLTNPADCERVKNLIESVR